MFGLIGAKTIIAEQSALYEGLGGLQRVETRLAGSVDDRGDAAGVELLSGPDGCSGNAAQAVEGKLLLLAEADEDDVSGADTGADRQNGSCAVLARPLFAADHGGYSAVEGGVHRAGGAGRQIRAFE